MNLPDLPDAAQDTRVWRVTPCHPVHVWAVNPDGDDELVVDARTPEIAAQIVAEHALVTAPYFGDGHRGGSWVSVLVQLQKQVRDLEQQLYAS